MAQFGLILEHDEDLSNDSVGIKVDYFLHELVLCDLPHVQQVLHEVEQQFRLRLD